MKLYVLTFCILLTSIKMMAQGNVTMTYGYDIQEMKQKFITKNKHEETVQGWRIQIITTDDRRKMEAAVSKFKYLYPQVYLKWKHMPPYYRVKVGAYENKMQLMGFLLDLKKDFRGVIPVVEQIQKSELLHE